MDYKDILKKTLDLGNYIKDKDAFIDEFSKILDTKISISLINKLDIEKQNELVKNLKENRKFKLDDYFSKEDVELEIGKIGKQFIEEYLNGILQTFSNDQKKSLQEFIVKGSFNI